MLQFMLLLLLSFLSLTIVPHGDYAPIGSEIADALFPFLELLFSLKAGLSIRAPPRGGHMTETGQSEYPIPSDLN